MENNQEYLKETYETCKEILKRWGHRTDHTTELHTPVGQIRYQNYKIFMAAKTHPYNHEWIEIATEWVIGENRNRYILTTDVSYDPIRSINELLANITQYLAGEEFSKKMDGSIKLVKEIHKAIKG